MYIYYTQICSAHGWPSGLLSNPLIPIIVPDHLNHNFSRNASTPFK